MQAVWFFWIFVLSPCDLPNMAMTIKSEHNLQENKNGQTLNLEY